MQKNWFLKRWFIQGLVVSLPIIITGIFLFWGIHYADILLYFVVNLLPPWFPKPIFPGMGLILIAGLFIGIGAVTENFVINKFVKLFNYLMSKLPFIKGIYSTVLKIVQNFLGSPDKFSKVLLIEYPRKGIFALVFKTNDAPEYICKLSGKKLISVFLPTSPSPFNGQFIMVPESDVIETSLKPEEAFKLIVSAGIVDKQVT